ncbi:MAG: WD40 repeat domain-containing protein [Micromonosporaceae bacterium]|nr:WD40 repeat domain-containing protein [Micromonosporaceae bacterium]
MTEPRTPGGTPPAAAPPKPTRNYYDRLVGRDQGWIARCRNAWPKGPAAVAQLLASASPERAVLLDHGDPWPAPGPDSTMEDEPDEGESQASTAARAVARVASALADPTTTEVAVAEAGECWERLRVPLLGPDQVRVADSLISSSPGPAQSVLRRLHDRSCRPAEGYACLHALSLSRALPPRRRPVQVQVLFDQAARGRAAVLHLAVLPGGPAGLYPDPEHMAFLSPDREFQESVAVAWETSRLAGRGRCVVWSVLERNRVPGCDLVHDSLGAAFGVGLSELDGQLRRLGTFRVRRLSRRCAVTGALDRQHAIGRVGGIPNKLQAADEASLRVVVPRACQAEIEQEQQRSELQIQVKVNFASTLAEAIRLTRTQLNPRWAAALGLVLALVLALAGVGYRWRADVDDLTGQKMAQQLLRNSKATGLRTDAALLLGGAAYRADPSNLTAAALREQAQSLGGLTRILRTPGNTQIETVNSVALAPAGDLIAAATQIVSDDPNPPGAGDPSDPDYQPVVLLWPGDGRGEGRLLDIPLSGTSATSVTFSPDGATLAVGTTAGAVTLVSLDSSRGWPPIPGASTHTIEAPDTAGPLSFDQVEHLSFSPDGTLLAISRNSGTVQRVQLVGETGAAGPEEPTTLDSFPGTRARFSPVADALAFLDSSGRPSLRHPRSQSGRWTAQELPAPATDLTFREDGTELAAIAEGTIILIDPASGTCRNRDAITSGSLVAYQGDLLVTDLGVLRDTQVLSLMETRLVSATWHSLAVNRHTTSYALAGHWRDASLGGVVMLWDTTDHLKRSVQLPGVPIKAPAALSPDGAVVAVLDESGVVNQRSASDGSPTGPVLARGTLAPTNLVYSPSGRQLAARSSRELSLWDTRTGQATLVDLSVPDSGATGGLGLRVDYPVSYHPGGTALATIRADNRVVLVDTAGSDHRQQAVGETASELYDVAFSPDGNHLLIAAADGLRIWQADPSAPSGVAGAPLTMPAPASTGAAGASGPVVINRAIYLNRNLVAASDKHQILLWDLKENTVSSLPNAGSSASEISHLATNPDGTTLAAGRAYGLVQRWDVASGRRLDAGLLSGVPLRDLRLTADGSLSVTTGLAVTTWSTDPDELLERICEITQRNLSVDERATYAVPSKSTVCPNLPRG